MLTLLAFAAAAVFLAMLGVYSVLSARVRERHQSGFLFGVHPADPMTAISVVAVLFAVGALAMLVPAWRATRVNPVAVLRRS